VDPEEEAFDYMVDEVDGIGLCVLLVDLECPDARRIGGARFRCGGSAVAYDWDALGQLVSVTREETTISYTYGITGMRERVSVETSGEAARWTESVWDGSQLAAEHDSDGTRYTYVWGPERTPLALEVVRPGQAAVTYAYHTDALGSVVAITSPAGTVAASYRYDPYGA